VLDLTKSQKWQGCLFSTKPSSAGSSDIKEQESQMKKGLRWTSIALL